MPNGWFYVFYKSCFVTSYTTVRYTSYIVRHTSPSQGRFVPKLDVSSLWIFGTSSASAVHDGNHRRPRTKPRTYLDESASIPRAPQKLFLKPSHYAATILQSVVGTHPGADLAHTRCSVRCVIRRDILPHRQKSYLSSEAVHCISILLYCPLQYLLVKYPFVIFLQTLGKLASIVFDIWNSTVSSHDLAKCAQTYIPISPKGIYMYTHSLFMYRLFSVSNTCNELIIIFILTKTLLCT
jgi:hypothetical protein